MNPRTRELVAGGAASASFLTFFGVAHLPLAASALLAAGVYVGGRLVFPARSEEPADDVKFLAAQGFALADTFQALAGQVRDARLRERIVHLAERLRKVFAELSRKPRSLVEARLLVTVYLPKAADIVRRYLRLSANPEVDDASLAAAQRSIDMIADALKRLYFKLFEEEVTEFEVANGTLQQILEMAEGRHE